MSNYEFWDELGKIFNAVVAYQEKNLEFNKRFISPWIRLGNIFEKQDRNKEAINAYEKAIEIDGGNPQNWFELGNLHFKMENHVEAISAYKQALELDPTFGLACSNLALTLATTGEVEQAITLYLKGIELLQEPKNKAMAWNRLGNAYRKLNQYDQALEAFHRADELDRENAGFRDSLDDVSEGPTVMKTPEAGVGEAEPVTVNPIELIVADNQAAETAATGAAAAAAPASEPPAAGNEAAEIPAGEAMDTTATAPMAAEAVGAPAAPAEAAAGAAEAPAAEVEAPASQPQPEVTSASVEETVTVVVNDSAETFTETVPVGATATDTAEAALAAEAEEAAASSEELPDLSTDIVSSEDVEPLAEEDLLAIPPGENLVAPQIKLEGLEEDPEPLEIPAMEDPAPNSLADQLLSAEPEVLEVPQHVAYEEYLKDMNEPLGAFDPELREEAEKPGGPEPAAKIDPSGDLQIEMDTKNAHVWNELGNVYFNSSAYDDAIVAYSKAIELDRWFAWPYSNLALAYVQKRRFVEAILLYQRSIELFTNDKDKAISWNRLGNVYRRLNDYENAIAAYQRADALDPDNSTLSLQSRFSLLGSFAMEQKPAYVQ